MVKRQLTIRFDEDEAELVAEALHQWRPEKAAEKLRAVRIRDLIDTELGRERRR